MKDLPNLLTILRIILIPLFCLSFYIESKFSWLVTVLIFSSASLTDFFDGYLARTLEAQSKFGKLFDPIADKMIVATAILMLVHLQYITGTTLIPAIIIVCREFFVSGLREYLARDDKTFPVNSLGKLKTISQIVAILLYLLHKDWIPDFLPTFFIWVAGLTSLASACLYFYENKDALLKR
ncbi:CDP-diacylglycerol--glycerol-3-phosphate 3-phosphatidyltransferase [Neorickettsia helminthoeca str. Oregon]|uniref:CDP-diacylglycerol--glycerol-3-phosphate 3-phosphatidyltransferase n=1 Tax=Neorickettsia helminthoeca str. Oregon TaxID=1286528 RepID=X5HKZ0_9RICK|nr:CDP-diacylglycerol--glycerol-3-phosphate 3-phosphatidyltransferase [Neorickettsia helminthoeca]AHX10990.1 CDP-diacylglycerol--glycerol-3-phosphate 3-phosphatidyltransferase [Neorickettsia helminthoeca str. Oregon]